MLCHGKWEFSTAIGCIFIAILSLVCADWNVFALFFYYYYYCWLANRSACVSFVLLINCVCRFRRLSNSCVKQCSVNDIARLFGRACLLLLLALSAKRICLIKILTKSKLKTEVFPVLLMALYHWAAQMKEVNDRKRIKNIYMYVYTAVAVAATTTKHLRQQNVEKAQTEQIKDKVFGLQLLFAI